MHPDRKIGIAMGILLIGVVGALFFRNEPLPDDRSLSREREQELNQRLRDRDVAVYLDDRVDESGDADEAPVWTLEAALKGQQPQEPAQPIAVAIPAEDLNRQTESELPPQFAPPTRSSDVDISQFDGVLVGGGSRSQTSARENATPSANKSAGSAKVENFEEYKVQFGDTLSGISQRFLGTSTRYRDIYEANQDRIDNPDRLRVGTAIRIPRVIR